MAVFKQRAFDRIGNPVAVRIERHVIRHPVGVAIDRTVGSTQRIALARPREIPVRRRIARIHLAADFERVAQTVAVVVGIEKIENAVAVRVATRVFGQIVVFRIQNGFSIAIRDGNTSPLGSIGNAVVVRIEIEIIRNAVAVVVGIRLDIIRNAIAIRIEIEIIGNAVAIRVAFGIDAFLGIRNAVAIRIGLRRRRVIRTLRHATFDLTSIIGPFIGAFRRHIAPHATHTLLQVQRRVALRLAILAFHQDAFRARLARHTLVILTHVQTVKTIELALSITRQTRRAFAFHLAVGALVHIDARRHVVFIHRTSLQRTTLGLRLDINARRVTFHHEVSRAFARPHLA